MKTLGLTGLLVIATILSGCEYMYGDHDLIGFDLSLSFRDASGKDLVEGITSDSLSRYDSLSNVIDPILYDMSVFINGEKFVPNSLLHYYKKVPYSILNIGNARSDSKITYTVLLTCPYVFGDDTEYEITSYWKRKGRNYTCNRLTFDGKEVDIVKQEYGQTFATIVID